MISATSLFLDSLSLFDSESEDGSGAKVERTLGGQMESKARPKIPTCTIKYGAHCPLER